MTGVLLRMTPEGGDVRLHSAGNGSDGDGTCLPVAVDVSEREKSESRAGEAASNRGKTEGSGVHLVRNKIYKLPF